MKAGATRKLRSQQGDLRNLTHSAREELHAWLRESSGTVPYKEIAQRLKEKFDVTVANSTLSLYRAEKYDELFGEPSALAGSATATPSVIVIRIEVPAGCCIDVSTEARPTDTGEST